jgi:hypothetical protein
MAILNTTVKIKRSKTPGNIPLASALDSGELAINTADGILYYKDATNVVKHFIDSNGISNSYLALAGGTMSGEIDMGNNYITNVLDPNGGQDAATKNYVDTSLAAVGSITFPTGDYDLLTETLNLDAFGINLYTSFDCLTQPSAIINTVNLGVLT